MPSRDALHGPVGVGEAEERPADELVEVAELPGVERDHRPDRLALRDVDEQGVVVDPDDGVEFEEPEP